MPFVKRERKYYKYGTEPNATIVGSFARIDKGVASGFSTSQYLTLPEVFTPSSNTWEQVYKITTGSDVSTNQIFVGNGGAYCKIMCGVQSGKFKLWLSSDNSTWNVADASTGSYTVLSSTEYYIRLKFTGTSYTLEYSLNGNEDSYTTDITVSSSTLITNSNALSFGANQYSSGVNHPFLGSIDLSQSYININGSRWWSGDSYTKVGSWIDDGVVSGFSTSNYLSLPVLFRPASNPWERVICFKTSDTVAATQALNYINFANDSLAGVHFHIGSGGQISAQISSNGSSWDIAESFVGTTVLSANTTYYAMIRFTGSEYQLLLSTTGEFNGEETLENSITSSTPIYQSNTIYDRLGFRSSSLPQVFTGSMDLTKCYGKINNKDWWHGTKAVESNKADADYHVDTDKLYDLIVRGNRTWFKQAEKQSATGTYTFTLEREYIGKMLFIGNGGGGSSSQRSSVWYYTGGGSGAVFEGKVKLPADTYTLTIGTLGYSYNRDNVAGHSSGVQSTDSFLTNSAGEELIRVGAGAMGTGTSSGGAGGVLTMGTIEVLETTLATNGNKGGGGSGSGGSSSNFALSAYDGTKTGYGAGTGSTRGAGNVYGIAGIFDLVLEADINNYGWYEDVGTKVYDIYAPRFEWITQTFAASDTLQTYVVPEGVASVEVSCAAAAGYSHTGLPGYGGKVRCNLAVTGGQTLYIAVGKQPTSASVVTYNASDVRLDNTGVTDTTSLQSRIIVAGAGGGQGNTSWAYENEGGAGGGLEGVKASNTYHSGVGGSGGTQTAGGAGGGGRSYAGVAGTFGLGGRGGWNGGGNYAGAGGAGWYGGGGGGYSGYDSKHWVCGGGGGSSYTDADLCTNVIHAQGVNNGDGYVTIRYKKFLRGGGTDN